MILAEGLTEAIKVGTRSLEDAYKVPKEERPAEKFMKEFWENTHPHPIMRGERFYGYCSLTLRPDINDPVDSVYISDIMTYEAKSGHATAALNYLKDLADKHGVTLTMIAKAYGTSKDFMKQKALVAWYERMGFTKGRKYGDGLQMSRAPQGRPSDA